ncbi:MAG: hypothetical protein K8T90_16830 [Planctomycetes bacterium]|nr:hypothetical protein [Planctomycetota bacterium]
MPRGRKAAPLKAGSSDNASGRARVGFEAQLWKMADAQRNNMDAAIERNLAGLGHGG